MLKKSFACLALLAIMTASLSAQAGMTGTEDAQAQAALTKTLRMSENIETPAVTFSFELEPLTVSGAPFDGSNMPAIPAATVAFSPEDKGSQSDGAKTLTKESKSLFAGANWPHAGIYRYSVKEKQSVDGSLPAGGEIEYSKAEYIVEVYVANGEKGLYVAAIGAEIALTDSGGTEGAGAKVDGTPGTPGLGGSHSKIVFANTYKKTKGTGHPADPNLAISKTVDTKDGSGHDFANRDMYFEFLVTVGHSGTNSSGAQHYAAYVMDGSGKVATSDKNFDGAIQRHDEYGGYISFQSGQPQLVRLKHGEWLSFVDLEVDAWYAVTESGTANFLPSVEVVKGGEKTADSAAAGQSLTVQKTYITPGEDRADFTNTFIPLTPVGVSIDNLPFAIAIFMGVPAAALTLLLLAMKRRREEEREEAPRGLKQ